MGVQLFLQIMPFNAVILYALHKEMDIFMPTK